MDIKVIASSSRGNCYQVTDNGSSLLVEAGIRFKDIQVGTGFGVSKLAGCLITHEHLDHAKSIKDVMKAGVDVYASAGTFEALGITGHRAKPITAMQPVQIGTWTVLPFAAIHDAVEPMGFVMASQGGKVLYLTDSGYCRYKFKALTHIMIECNHSLELLHRNLAAGIIDIAHKNRVMRDHMSLEHCLDFLRANDLGAVKEIHLLHMSDQNSNADEFKLAVQRLTGKPTYVASA